MKFIHCSDGLLSKHNGSQRCFPRGLRHCPNHCPAKMLHRMLSQRCLLATADTVVHGVDPSSQASLLGTYYKYLPASWTLERSLKKVLPNGEKRSSRHLSRRSWHMRGIQTCYVQVGAELEYPCTIDSERSATKLYRQPSTVNLRSSPNSTAIAELFSNNKIGFTDPWVRN
jgi:hypothetical protein